METLFSAVSSNWLYYTGAALSLWGAYAFARFLWGMTDYIFAMGNEEEKMHGRTNMIWGTMWMIGVFFIWEAVRAVAGWFGQDVGDTTLGVWVAVIIIAAVLLYLIWELLTAAPAKKEAAH